VNDKPRQPTKEELADRIEYARQLLASGRLKSQIKRALRKQYGDLDHRTIERYLARAREQILLAIHAEKVHQRAYAFALYCSVLADPKASVRDRIAAQERIDKLLGLEEKAPDDPTHLLEKLGIDPAEVRPVAPGDVPPEPVAIQGPVVGPGPVLAGPDPLRGTDPAGAVVVEAGPDRPGPV
jgi:hypothetical protein